MREEYGFTKAQQTPRHPGIVTLIELFFRLGDECGRDDFGCHKVFLSR
jgi:hypothetical protein